MFGIHWVTVWCFMRHVSSWEYVRAGADGWDYSEGMNTWYCSMCKTERQSRLLARV